MYRNAVENGQFHERPMFPSEMGMHLRRNDVYVLAEQGLVAEGNHSDVEVMFSEGHPIFVKAHVMESPAPRFNGTETNIITVFEPQHDVAKQMGIIE